MISAKEQNSVDI